ncbi:hypothetical protein QE152_g4317 [Popillia japonica]|uniref:Uncharacterized protein n=1 Tax=Popillia japonica TaxID=7064 RepID=A0AAW1N1C4_POPJA
MLKICERRILRGILGPVEEEEGNRNLMDHEIQEINDGSDIVKFVKNQRLEWWGHIQRMEENKIPKIINKWDPNPTRKKGRPMKIENSIEKSKNRKMWFSICSKDNKQKIATGE